MWVCRVFFPPIHNDDEDDDNDNNNNDNIFSPLRNEYQGLYNKKNNNNNDIVIAVQRGNATCARSWDTVHVDE